MESFINSWAPVSQWPAKDQILPAQAKAALTSPATRLPFAEWLRDFEQERKESGLRGSNVSKDRILHLVKGELIRFSDYFPPDKWTPELLIARLLHHLHRLHALHSSGLFYDRGIPENRIHEAFFDLFLEVKKNYPASKRHKSAIFAAVLPSVDKSGKNVEKHPEETTDKTDSSNLLEPNMISEGVDMMDVDSPTRPSAGTVTTNPQGKIFRGGWPEEPNEPGAVYNEESVKKDGHLVALVMTTYDLDEEAQQLQRDLQSYPPAEKRQELLSSIETALQPRTPSTSSFGLPSVWSQSLSISEACRLLSMESREPFYLEDTPVSQTLQKHQVQGVAFIQKSLLTFQKAALLDHMGFGKTRQTLLGLERALRSVPHAKKPSLIVVPSGGVGEQWIKEGLASTNTLSFFAVGGGFGGTHKSHRVEYFRTTDFDKIAAIEDRFAIVLCTYSTVRKLVIEESSMATAFHAVAVDEVQVLRKWKQSQTFCAIDQLQPTWRIGVTATPLMNGPPDMKGFLAFFRNKEFDVTAMRKSLDKHGSPFKDGSKISFYRTVPEVWESFVDGSDFREQADALAKVASHIKFAISRDSDTRDENGERVGPQFPPLLISRQTVTFTDQEAKKAYVEGFNSILDGLWTDCDGRKRMKLDKLTDLATMTLSPFAAKIPADQAKIARMNLDGATLAQICETVLEKQVSPQQALEEVRSPKLEWLAAFLASVVVQRREKVLLFVLNNREQLLVRAFVEALGVATANYHSKLSPAQREMMIQGFNMDGGPPVFVTTWEMGSVGFNMQQKCCIVVAMSLYYNKNAETQGRARIHRPGQKRPVLYIQCRQAPSLDTIFLLKHADRKESAELYARLQLAKEDSALLERIFGDVAKATGGNGDVDEVGDIVKSDLAGEADMSGKTMELFQSILAKDTVSYDKALERLEV